MMLSASWLARSTGNYSGSADPMPPPGVEAILEALSEKNPPPHRIADALTIFAWECVSNDWDLTCTVADVDALWDILESTDQTEVSRLQARHWVTDAWVDAVAAQRGAPGVDALSGLHTVSYLFGRVNELDRLADSATAHLVTLVVSWEEPESPWTRISCILQVASALREHVRTEATLSQFGTHRAVALVPDDNRARIERGTLVNSLNTGELGTLGMQVDLIPLPEDRSRVTELIVRLRDGSLVGDKSGPIGRYQRDVNSLD